MSLRRTAWLEAAWIFMVSRLALLFITIIATRRIFPPSQPIWLSWLHWDVNVYIDIAQHGYSSLQNTVFFPLWPLLMRGAGSLLGASTMSYYIAG
ncbi:MAG TPA: hypothetical protein VH593_15315, partial [Ktedonobacteraceae bacterium]